MRNSLSLGGENSEMKLTKSTNSAGSLDPLTESATGQFDEWVTGLRGNIINLLVSSLCHFSSAKKLLN